MRGRSLQSAGYPNRGLRHAHHNSLQEIDISAAGAVCLLASTHRVPTSPVASREGLRNLNRLSAGFLGCLKGRNQMHTRCISMMQRITTNNAAPVGK